MNSRALHIHIDRLVVEGLPAQRQQRFVRALERQLAQLADDRTPQWFTGGGARRIATLDAGQLPTGATPENAASQVTNALRGSLSGKGAGRHG